MKSKDLLSEEFGKFLKSKRENKGYTQHELAELIGKDTSTIGHYEIGRRSVYLPTIIQLSSVLDFDVDDFLKIVKDKGIDIL